MNAEQALLRQAAIDAALFINSLCETTEVPQRIRSLAGDAADKLIAAIPAPVVDNVADVSEEAGKSEEFDHLQELVEAARAVVRRWNEPSWKDVPATGGFIYRLRDALDAYGPQSDDVDAATPTEKGGE